MLPAGQRGRLYDLPDIRRVPVLWHTATTVRYAFDNGDKQQWTTGQDRVWCVPDDAAWAEIEQSYYAWREALRAFAQALRLLGTYERRLKEAGADAPNPLTPTVIVADNPDGWQGYFHGDDLFLLPGEQGWRGFERAEMLRHTPKMVRLASDSLIEQTRVFACEDDHDWEAANGAMLAAREARDAFKRTLNKYGSYGRAVARREYDQQKQEEPVTIPTTADDREVIEVEEIETLRQFGYDALRLDAEHWLIWEEGSADESERRVGLAELRDLVAELESTQMPAEPELHDLPLAQLHPHPDNPRLTMREEVVEAIAARLRETGRFERVHALRVRPLERGYQIIAGHHRREAAERAGLGTVPCWVQVLDDVSAYMELAADNAQGELTPLEIGLHALGAVEHGKGGRGQQGGISAYARAVGRSQQYLSQLVAAARVYQAVKGTSQTVGFTAKARHLAAIARAPQEHWPALVQRLLTEDWTVEATNAAVEELLAVALTEEELLELQRQVRRRGGIYHGSRGINGAITRHNVTLPGQSERQYLTEQLREALTAFPEREERMPERLPTWQIEEWPGDWRIIARHVPTGVHTHVGTLKQIIEEAERLHLDVERLHSNGWTFGRIDDTGEWTGTHPDHGEVYGPELPTLVYRADLARDRSLAQQIRQLTEQEEFDEAERLVLAMHNQTAKDEEMRVLSIAMHKASQRAQRARWEAEAEPAQAAETPAEPTPLPDNQLAALYQIGWELVETRLVRGETLYYIQGPNHIAKGLGPISKTLAGVNAVINNHLSSAMAADDHLLEQAEQELPAWSLWRDEDGEACGGMHDSGYKLGPMESVTELVNEARRLTPLLAEFAEHKWMVSHNVSYDIWFAEHMQLGTVEAKTLPDLAFSAYLARYDRREPDLPRDLWRATWLDGWQYEGDTTQGRPRFVRGGEAWEPTYNELCHVYSYESQPTPAAAPAPVAPRSISAQIDAGELRAIWQALNGDEAPHRLALNVVSRLAQEAGVSLTRMEVSE
jgi:ParB/RepB/Spo0J family partition protein